MDREEYKRTHCKCGLRVLDNEHATYDDTGRARIFEHELRRLLSAYRDIPDWKEWWDNEMKKVEEVLNEYGVSSMRSGD